MKPLLQLFALELENIQEFKDKQFYMYSCNDPSWNRALVRIRDKYGEVKQDPSTGFGINYGIG